MGALDALGSVVRPADLRRLLRQQPDYVTNRDRAGAVLHDGFAAYDVYKKWQTVIFLTSLGACLASGYMGYKRRKKGSEAWLTWGSATIGFGTVAYLTRPTRAEEISTPSEPGTGAIGYIDKRVAKLRSQDPNFADKAFARAVHNPSIKPQWDALNPLIQATVL